MIRFIFASLLIASTTVFAGESGYILNGETRIVFKDGKKVGDWPAPAAKQRKPAEFYQNQAPIYYQDDGYGRCYSLDNIIINTKTLSCIKK